MSGAPVELAVDPACLVDPTLPGQMNSMRNGLTVSSWNWLRRLYLMPAAKSIASDPAGHACGTRSG
jgi:hypothetical protein